MNNSRCNALRACAVFAFAVAFCGSSVRADGLPERHPDIELPVRVYNASRMSASQLNAGLTLTARLIERAGIAVAWIDCTNGGAACDAPATERDTVLRIVQGPSDGARRVSEPAGEAVGAYATVFYDAVARRAGMAGADADVVFALTAAHEIGHLLLGPNQHSGAGLMKANWRAADLKRASREASAMGFSDAEAHRMVATVIARVSRLPGDKHTGTLVAALPPRRK